ncbi:MAG: PspA/IM30 family protein [Gemmatimonadota bacterium]|jgi:phage shock protein A|nr:PspA/IM30 family protein [Gemmatimonadota bacterium]MDH4349258.1 PspA/IM30 family protein [Gemmatimonadota bacterium]MDH5284216.1 PspA/IM30 family protein [Gemmatimonadota bacterium]
MGLFARVGRLFRGFIGLFISGLEESNPEALMDAARQEFREKMAQYNMALARMAGVAERLKGQVKLKGQRAKDLERRILANHQAGNAELAGSLARELQELKVDLATDAEELTETEEAYQANLRQAKLVQKEFEAKVKRLEKQLDQVKIKEAQAEAAGALSNATFRVGDLGDTMKTVEEVLQKRYEKSAGKARVAKDLVDMDKVREKESEEKALEQSALAEFLASQGIQAGPTPQGQPAQKEIGPA